MRGILLLALVSIAVVQTAQPPAPQDSGAFLEAQFAPLPPLPPADLRRIEHLLAQMTLTEKVGQMTQLEIGMVTEGQDLDLRINP